MKLGRGISPVIATVIIVAVAVAISIAVVSWIMNVWGTISGGVEMIKIYPDSKIYDNGTVVLHLKNDGSATAVISKIEVVSLGTDNKPTGDTQLEPGKDGTVKAQVSQCIAGGFYLVKVYTESGNVYQAHLQCVPSS